MSRKHLKETAELQITVKADKGEWNKAQEKAFNRLHKDLVVKGFRKGSVPLNIASKSISQNQIWTTGSQSMIEKLSKEANKELKKEDVVLGQPAYKIEKITSEELEMSFIYPIYPEVKLMDYKNLGLKYTFKPLTKKEIELEIDKLRQTHSLLRPKDGKITKGDFAIFDFAGSVDKKLFEGGQAKDFELEIGSKRFIPGFEEQMIGLKVGDKKTIKVKFPDDYHSQDLKGKDAEFKVDIKQVKYKDLPELNDDFVKQVNIPNITNVEKLRNYIEKVFNQQNEVKSKESFANDALKKIKEQSNVPISHSLLSQEIKRAGLRFDDRLKKQGLTRKVYFQKTGLNQVALDSQLKIESEKSLKNSLILAEIAKLENIELKDKDYDLEYEKLAQVYNQPVEQIKKTITKQQIQVPLTNDKVIEKLISFLK